MDEETRTGSGAWWAILLTLLLSPVVYVLSIGPAALLVKRTGQGKEAAITFYAPVIWLHMKTPLKEPLEWYMDFWER